MSSNRGFVLTRVEFTMADGYFFERMIDFLKDNKKGCLQGTGQTDTGPVEPFVIAVVRHDSRG